MTWRYSENLYQRTTIEKLAEEFLASLRVLIAHCCAQTEKEYTPSDFPLANLSREKLDKVLSKLRRPKETSR